MPGTAPLNDADEEKGSPRTPRTPLDQCVKAESAVATNISTTSYTKLKSAATSRSRVKDELLGQQLESHLFQRPSMHSSPRRSPPGRAQPSQRKRAKISIKLGEISSSPAPPAQPESSTSTHAPLPSPRRQQAPLGHNHVLGHPESEAPVATTFSLTSLIHNPSPAAGAGGMPAYGTARAHGVYVAPTRNLPVAPQRSAARAGAGPVAGANRKAAAPFKPPADAEEVPEIVRTDRAEINTMHVGRRTSSRWSEYARDGAPWAPEEEAWLLRHHRAGCPPHWLSMQLSRTPSAVKARLKRNQDPSAWARSKAAAAAAAAAALPPRVADAEDRCEGRRADAGHA